MGTLKKIGTFLLGGFRAGARTAGLSPKALAPAIGGAVVGLLALVGLTPADIAAWISNSTGVQVSPEALATLLALIAGKLAAVLLPPGNVILPKPAPPAAPNVSMGAGTGTGTVARVEFSTGGLGSMRASAPGSDALLSSVARDRLGLD